MSFELGLASLALTFALAVRYGTAVYYADQDGPDADFHRWYIRLLREHGHRAPRSDPRGIGPGELTYPALFHWALSFGSDSFVERFARHGGLLMDCVVASVTAMAIVMLGDVSVAFGLALAAMHLIAPQLTFAFIGPRAFTLSPRAMAQNAFMVATVFLVLAPALSPSWATLAFGLCSVLVSLALLSSKFALQNLFFVMIGVLLMGWEEATMALVLAIPLAMLVSKGFFLRQLRGHWQHSLWYLKLNQTFVSARGDWRALGRSLAKGDIRGLLKEVLVRNPILVGLSRHATLFLTLAIAIPILDSDNAYFASLEAALVLSLVSLAPWVLTSIGAMRVFGEAERYLEYSFSAHWILLWAIVPSDSRGFVALVLSAFFVIFYAVNLAALASQRNCRREDNRRAILCAIANREPVRVLPTDATHISHLLAQTRVEVVGPTCQFSLAGDGERYFLWYFSSFPFVSAERWQEILETYRPDIVLVSQASKQAAIKETGSGYDLSRFRLAAISGTIELWEFEPETLHEHKTVTQ